MKTKRENEMKKLVKIISMGLIMAGVLLGVISARAAQDNSYLVMDKSGSEVYLIWQEDTGEIWFNKSTDKGLNFGDDIHASIGITGTNRNPAMAIDGSGNLYAIWENVQSDGNIDLYFGKMLRGAGSFQCAVVPLDAHLGAVSHQLQPSIDVSNNGTVVITWVNENGANDGVYYAKSTDAGSSLWNISAGQIKRVDDTSATSFNHPCVKLDSTGANKYIAWDALKNNTRKVFLNKLNSLDVRSFVSDVQINDDASSDNAATPSLVVGDTYVYAAWENEAGSDKDIYVDKSNDGETWGTDVQINDDSDPASEQKEPVVSVDNNGDIFAAWSDLKNGEWDIYFAHSVDNGATFKTNIIVNGDTGTANQDKPSLYLSANGKSFCLSWTDYRSQEGKIYFNRNSILDYDNAQEALVDSSIGGVLTAGANTGVQNAQVSIPSNVMDAPTNVSITKISALPPFGHGSTDTQISKAVDFGPSGTTFDQPVRIKIPYTQAELTSAGLSDPSRLRIYHYNLKTLAWERINNTYVDQANQIVYADVSHFSVYGLGFVPAAIAANGGGGGGGGGGCFIATAAYGSYDEANVKILREFRDKVLLTNKLGVEFVKFYYRHSPPIADYIRDKKILKNLVKWGLKPLVFVAKHTHNNE